MLVANRASTEVIDAFIDLNKGTVYLSAELFPFFCMYIVPRQNVLERKRSFYPRLYIPAQGNYDRPTWYGES
jgi:hypothetical protein